MEEDAESSAESDTTTATEPAPARARPKPTEKFCADNTMLIQCVRARPVLYDPGHSRYMDVQLKNNIWNKIAKQLKVDPAVCKTRWNNIRDNYRKSLRKRHPNGINSYKFARMLGFMDRYYKGQPIAEADNSDDEAAKPKEAPVAVKVAQSDTDQESAIDEFERSSVSVSGNQLPCTTGANSSQAHSVDVFLAAIATSLKGLSPYDLSMAKAEIFATVHKYELKGIVEGGWGAREVNPLP